MCTVAPWRSAHASPLARQSPWLDRIHPADRNDPPHGCRACHLEDRIHQAVECGGSQSARADGGRHRRHRVGRELPADDHGDRHRAGAPLDHAAQRDRRHGAPGGARARARSSRPAPCSSRSTSRSRRPSSRRRQAQAALAETTLDAARDAAPRIRRCRRRKWTRRAPQRDVAQAQIARTRAIIARKTIRAPFRARVGIADVHLGQYLNEGDRAHHAAGRGRRRVHVDFTVAQRVAAGLRRGDSVEVVAGERRVPDPGPHRRDRRAGGSRRPGTPSVRARIAGAGQLPCSRRVGPRPGSGRPAATRRSSCR